MKKWEYCYLYGVRALNPMETFSPRIAIFSISQPHLIKTELGQKNKDEQTGDVAAAIAKLGEEGWEMVSVVEESTSYYYLTFFFKRPKE